MFCCWAYFLQRAAGDMLGISGEEMEWRLNQLASLLPGLVPTLMRAPAPFVARAAANQEQIAVRLLTLKTAFPGVSQHIQKVMCSLWDTHAHFPPRHTAVIEACAM